MAQERRLAEKGRNGSGQRASINTFYLVSQKADFAKSPKLCFVRRAFLPSAPPPARRWEPLYSFPLFLSVSSISTTNLFFFLLGSGTEGDSSRLNHVCLEHTPCLLSHSNTSWGVFWRWIVRPFSSPSMCPPASPLASSSCFPFALLIYCLKYGTIPAFADCSRKVLARGSLTSGKRPKRQI